MPGEETGPSTPVRTGDARGRVVARDGGQWKASKKEREKGRGMISSAARKEGRKCVGGWAATEALLVVEDASRLSPGARTQAD